MRHNASTSTASASLPERERCAITAVTATGIRVEFAPNGTFTDPNDPPADPEQPSAPMVVGGDPTGTLTLSDEAGSYRPSSAKATLRISKTDPRMTITDAAGRVVLSESKPLSWNDSGTTQTLSPQSGEQFYGAGEQNGGYNHTGKVINVANSFNWNEGGYNNSQPYYVSTAGYGVFRNTFAPGVYTFGGTDGDGNPRPVSTTEKEQRFDAYYFVGDLKSVIGQYTELVGKPFMPPIYGLELGDSDCYLNYANRGKRNTLDALKVADGYVSRGIPNGWMLVNDGYGCGYEDLAEVGKGLNDRNMQLGLWTENGLANQEAEVAAGVRVRKLDVAWVGPGYRFALDGCQTAYDGIQASSNARGFVYQPNSWAGAQRCAVLWSGDQSGSWDYIRWQIPTYAASTMSGIAYNTGDVDGIFGGSPQTYVRDLQWKAFLPTTMTMDGWAKYDKQPWRYGEPYTGINKKYLLLKERLLPYSYSYSREAATTGVGQVRPLYLEYPDDPVAASDKAKYEFLSGKDFLVAPVYSDTEMRNDIYLPKGTWIDYWTGRTYTGPTTIDGYHAPLDKLPLFVRGGAVVPMWPEGTTSWKTRDTSRLTLDVYPQGKGEFSLYSDDGITRDFTKGQYATQQFTVDAPTAGAGTVTVNIGAAQGKYKGQPTRRSYDLTVHSPAEPSSVTADGRPLRKVATEKALERATVGWFYDKAAGVVTVKTPAVPIAAASSLVLRDASAVVADPDYSQARVGMQVPKLATAGTTVRVPVTFTNTTAVPVTAATATVTSATGGVTATPVTFPTPIAPGASATAPAQVSIAAGVKAQKVTLTATASYTAGGRQYQTDVSGEFTVPFAQLADAYSNNGVTDVNSYAGGNLDGGGNSLAAEQLAAVGVKPGEPVTADGLSYTWPAVAPEAADNVPAGSQTIAVSGSGNTVGLLGTGIGGGGAGGEVTLHYSDGSTSTGNAGYPNWCCTTGNPYGATLAAASKGRYTENGLANTTTEYRLFSSTVPVTGGEELVAVTLPGNAGMHVFALAVGDT